MSKSVGIYDSVENVLAKLEGCDCRSLPVVRQGQLLGMVTMENIGEFLAIQSAVGAGRAK